ncbi:MAG: InlB B-repeat-containing protein [Clostridia bacterium]|nr:InlB B-repeat-containing protein [Clostridia bacterium]
MSKKKFITLMMCLAMACASMGVMSACDGDSVSIESNSNADSVLDETPSVVEFKVTFNSLGGSDVKAQFVKNGAKVTKPEDPTREDYTFVEWQLNGNTYDFSTRVTGDITLTAKWEKKAPAKFTVSFVVEGETEPFHTAEVETGKKVMAPADEPMRGGYVFDGWTLNGADYDFETPVTEALTLTAKWINLWMVTFDVGEGTAVEAVEVKDGDKLAILETIPTRENHIFDGWMLNGEEYDFETPVTGALTLTAKWANAWTVTFDVGECTAVDPITVKDGATVSAPATTLEGYYVADWLVDGESYDFEKPIVSDITLTAVWKAYGLTSNQIGVHAYGWNQTHNAEYFNMAIGSNGETVITAKFSGSTTHYPALVLRELFAKEYYTAQIEKGDTRLEFNLAIDGDVSNLYVFGKALNEYWCEGGVYTIGVDLQYIVDNYDKVAWIGTKVEAKNAELNNMFLAWKSTDWTSRNYVFTISDVTLKPTPIFNIDFVAGSTDLIEIGATTALKVSTNLDGEIKWKSSDESVATVANGVVTGIKGGTVTIMANLKGTTASKTVYVVGGLSSNQIGVVNAGWAYENKAGYFDMAIGSNGEMIVTTKIQAVTANPSALVLRKLESKEYYEKLLANGYTKLSFNLVVGGTDGAKVSDLYVFGKALTSFANTDGVYTVDVNLQDIVDNYATVGTLGNGVQATKAQLNQMLIAWKDTTNNWSARNYVFTISNTSFIK